MVVFHTNLEVVSYASAHALNTDQIWQKSKNGNLPWGKISRCIIKAQNMWLVARLTLGTLGPIAATFCFSALAASNTRWWCRGQVVPCAFLVYYTRNSKIWFQLKNDFATCLVMKNVTSGAKDKTWYRYCYDLVALQHPAFCGEEL